MSEETRDDFAAWRGLLRQPDALPEQGVADKEAAWDKLFERLSERPRRLFFPYRVAAACLLILLVPATRFFQNRPVQAPNRPIAQPVTPLAVTQGRRHETGSNRSAAKLPVTRLPAALSPNGYPAAPPATRRQAHSPILMHPGSPEVVNRDTVLPMLAADPPKIIIQPQKPKKQWKVVDLNELDPGHQPPHGMAASRERRPLRVTINLSSENR
jgi:hypothetical protein